jgi:hypothetical protein
LPAARITATATAPGNAFGKNVRMKRSASIIIATKIGNENVATHLLIVL